MVLGAICLLSVKKRLNHCDSYFANVIFIGFFAGSHSGVKFHRANSCKNYLETFHRHEIKLIYHVTEFAADCFISACKLFLIRNNNCSVDEKTRSIIRKWSENECKEDVSLGLTKTLYKNLLAKGYSFETDASSKSCLPSRNIKKYAYINGPVTIKS
ncbi:unnamed protein product [Brugia pahangi]|uniref:VHS domain-containing protein n=1 Tax=Brugia pahangi TaxID=6280 RepID=A0A0N4T369_BRUPA|nr:unnamed protein product [Brugia pahangi]